MAVDQCLISSGFSPGDGLPQSVLTAQTLFPY